jgi:hypothetical protein
MNKVANRNGRGFGWEISRARFATPAELHTHMYITYAAKGRDLPIVQGSVSVAPCLAIRNFFTAVCGTAQRTPVRAVRP